MGKTLATLVVRNALALGMTACWDKTPSERARATGNAIGDAVQATGEYLNQPQDLDDKLKSAAEGQAGS